MPSFNKVMLIGNLTRDPQLKQLPSGTSVAEFGLACNRRWRTEAGEEREEVLFVDVAAFGKQAEVINQYCQKGRPLFVEGRLKYDTWEDRESGGKRHKISIVVESFQFLGSRDDGGRDEGEQRQSSPGRQAPPPARQAAPPAQRRPGGRPTQNAQQPPSGEEEQFDDNDIPF